MTNMPVMVDQKVEEQSIPQGPMASQVAIKMLGTNGGGYTNANAAHPFENPTPLSNFIQMLSIFAIGSGLTYYLGRMTKNQAHGWSVWAAMMVLFLAGVLLCWWAEAAGNPIHQQLGVAAAGGNMEGKEVRFGIFNSALFATVTTDASCGAVNRCTIPSPRWADSFRCSTSNWAKSSSAAWGRDFTACWSSWCWRCSSPA